LQQASHSIYSSLSVVSCVSYQVWSPGKDKVAFYVLLHVTLVDQALHKVLGKLVLPDLFLHLFNLLLEIKKLVGLLSDPGLIVAFLDFF
jgi:hypothetical protein